MTDRINSVIKFDLHIHSKASAYKEASGIVDNSTKENLNVLFSKLNKNNVALFSITDHNRFDADLYLEAIKILQEQKETYPNIKNILAGVEFDVQLEEDLDKCHIITIFDTKNKKENLEKIATAIENNKLVNKEEKYKKEGFENILKDIGLNVILIACQRKALDNKSGKENSFSDAVKDVGKVLKAGYVDALEFQKAKVEGILQNSLNKLDIPLSMTLLSGSDCHDWRQYPYHDIDNKNLDFLHSKAKMLPTFKGLLMAITSPKTRFNCNNFQSAPIHNIKINGNNIELVNGINVIIGENGSGKTSILEILDGRTKEKYIKKIENDNNITVEKTSISTQEKYIKQGQIVKNFYNNELFKDSGEENYIAVDNSKFESSYEIYAKELKKAIEENIEKSKAEISKELISIDYKDEIVKNGYYITINDNIDEETNPHENAYNNIKEVVNNISKITKEPYFKSYESKLNSAFDTLNEILKEIKQLYFAKKYSLDIINIIKGCIGNYSLQISQESTTPDKEYQGYLKKKTNFIKDVFEIIQNMSKTIKWPSIPEKLPGITQKKKQGFCFNCESRYNDKSLENEFLSKMFNNTYCNLGKLQSIKTKEELSNAISRCGNTDNINSSYANNLKNFIDLFSNVSQFITDDNGGNIIGNTLGEMSLSYYKYYTQDTANWRVLIIDQPEDNISNNNIRKNLINYFNNIRDNKQLIFVTHNPLLVVNLDVDNVIFVKNKDGVLNIESGCLEYENEQEQTSILNLIAESMDGGKETIERRLKVYGKSY